MQTTQAIRAQSAARVDLASLGVGALAVALLAVAVAFVAIRLTIPTDGAVGAYVTSTWQADGMQVGALGDGAGPLLTGDLVTAVEGQPLRSWLEGSRARPSVTAGATLDYTVMRDGAPRSVPVELQPFPLVDVLIANWSTLLWALAMAVVTTYLFLRRPQEAATRALVIFGVGVVGSSVPWMIGIGPLDLVNSGIGPLLYLVATFPIYILFWSAALHFALVFPAPIADQPLQGRLVMLAYLLPLGAQTAWAAGTYPGAATLLGWIGSWTAAQLVIVPAVILAGVGAMALQWRRAGPMERSKLRWVVGAAVGAAIAVLLGWYLPAAMTGSALLPWGAIGLAGMPFPVVLGLAVSRHALFGIETILHRSLVYGGLTAGVIAVYAAAVVVLGAVLPGEGPYAVTLLATGAAALVALPLRDRLQHGVSRLLYGDRDEPYRAIARLGERLEASLQPGTVLPMVAETVAEALRLPYAAIELRRNGGAVVVAAHGTPHGELERLPLIHHGEEIGWLALAQRAPDEPFTGADRSLLTELARQAGAAAYAVRLTAELQRSREQLVSAREEERRRLRRDLHDGVGPALAGSLMKLEAMRELARRRPTDLERQLTELAAETRGTIDDVRRLAYDLRPPALDQLGLVAALEQDAARLAANGSVFRISAPARLGTLPAAVEVAAYRIGLEALTNVAHHAGARHAWLDLRPDGDALLVEVRDDGRGLPSLPRSGVGLTSMRERAEELGGSLELASAREGGVRVTARLPLPGDIGLD